MTVRSLLAIGVLGASSLAACSGGGLVQPGNDLNPTPAPTGLVATASPTPIGPTPTASPVPTATPVGATPTPTPVVTVAPTATPTTVGATPTATPTMAAATPTATPTAPATTAACTTSASSPTTMTYTLSGSAQTITLPTYNVFSGTSNVPSNTPPGTVLTIKDSQNNFDNLAASTSSDPAYAARTKDFFTSLSLSQSTTFGTGSNTQKIPLTLTSACITNGTTYFIDLFALGSLQYMESDVAVGNSLTGNIEVTVNPFPANITADVVLSH